MMALVPAGGRSVRMGRPKLLLPLGTRTVLEHVIAALRHAAVAHILVVVGPHVPQLVAPAEAAGAHVLLLAGETPDMRATVEHGLRWLEERLRPRPEEGWLLVPADHPTLDAAVVRDLAAARATHPERSIFLPAFDGQRGHPALIAWKHVAGIRALPPGLGLNVYLRQQAAETVEVAVSSADVLCDLDTPEDYERLLRRFG
jgi:molybdenum cofactor cytidylyltransferase